MGERLRGALKFGTYILKPDGHQPILGDTQGTEALGWKTWLEWHAKTDGYPELVYSLTAGSCGSRPTQPDAILTPDFNQTVYLALKTGFLERCCGCAPRLCLQPYLYRKCVA